MSENNTKKYLVDTANWRPRQKDEWVRWADHILDKVEKAVAEGINEDQYFDYPTAVDGFCFELYPDLPYLDSPFMVELLEKIVAYPRYVKESSAFEKKYGRPFLEIDKILISMKKDVELGTAQLANTG